MKQLDEQEVLQFVKRATAEMAAGTLNVICSVAGVVSEDEGEFVGTGFRIGDGERRWLVTAHHVVEEARQRYARLAVTAIRERPPIALTRAPTIDEARDLALFRLPDDFPEVEAWPVARMERATSVLDEDFLFAHGFPGVTARFSPLLKALMSQSLPYGVMKRDDDLPDNMKPFQFGMDFDPKNVRPLEGTGDAWPDPRGLSGAPIWRIGAAGRSVEQWSPDHAQLVGVMTQWRPDHHLLVASTADAIIDLLG